MENTITIEKAKQTVLDTMVNKNISPEGILALANSYATLVNADYSERMAAIQFAGQTPSKICSCKENEACSDCPKQVAPEDINYKNLAQFGYEAYSKSTGNKNYQGNEMPKFEDLSEPIVNAWIAATKEIIDVAVKAATA